MSLNKTRKQNKVQNNTSAFVLSNNAHPFTYTQCRNLKTCPTSSAAQQGAGQDKWLAALEGSAC